jgi:ketosteroid isomerase-like protein
MRTIYTRVAPRLLAAAVGLLMVSGQVAAHEPDPASEKDAVMATIHQYVDSLNKGDLPNVIAACADESSIVDEFPPYQWHGKDTCAHWLTELAAYNTSMGLTEAFNTLREPRRVDVSGDRAYVVVPADFRYTVQGKKGAEIDATFTVALRKEEAGWRITGWAWSRPELDFDY